MHSVSHKIPKPAANGPFGFRLVFSRYNTAMIRASLLSILLALPVHAVHADDDMARLAADALPIDRALTIVGERYHGRMIAAELAEEKDRAVYDFRWLTPQGNVLQVRLDAATGRFLLIEGVGQTEARK